MHGPCIWLLRVCVMLNVYFYDRGVGEGGVVEVVEGEQWLLPSKL